MKVTFGEGHSLWDCLECGSEFVWHKGSSDLKRPSECGACGQKDKFKLIRRLPDEYEASD